MELKTSLDRLLEQKGWIKIGFLVCDVEKEFGINARILALYMQHKIPYRRQVDPAYQGEGIGPRLESLYAKKGYEGQARKIWEDIHKQSA